MLEITGDHVAKLNDEDLRTLVTKLCEAELSRCNLFISAVTAGGDQNAPDGGIDIRVDLSSESTVLDFIPRAKTGFQVKCSDMSRGKIIPEMCPGGHLRDSISDLAVAHGAYVIVSSHGSIADSVLKERRVAMRDAMGSHPDVDGIHLDFYDRDRLARWVNRYPGVTLWLREHIQELITGWRGYSNWAFGDPAGSEYLLDDTGRIVSRQTESHKPMPVEQGIQAMRGILAKPGGVVRLIGLSGTGKTRLVQALFDVRVGTDALDSALVLYTDQGLDSPVPTAREMLNRLGATGTRSIIVVDNCNPITHRVLAQTVSTYPEILSLITIEYDVADDEPEETQVFELEPASEKVLEEILQHLTPHVSQLDRHRIASAELSGGNARIALALAKTIKQNESLGSLNDLELFKRLFYQRQDIPSETLMYAAEACALVYSFDGESLKGDSAELPVLAGLVGISPMDLYRHVGTLYGRDLVQRRSRWRAILPHAIANRLACQALRHLPPLLIYQAMSETGRARLLKSFSRRLSFLHDCEPAKELAGKWLSDWMLNPDELDEHGLSLFHNLAPIDPERALRIIEKTIRGENGISFLLTEAPHRWRWAGLLRSLAYDPALFDRATFLLAKFYAAEPENYKHNSTQHIFTELFHIHLSGTHALPEQRLALIRKLLGDEEAGLQRSGLEALDAMLETSHFSSSHDFSFGAHSRDYGWEPKTWDSLSAWFRQVIDLVGELALSECPHSDRVRRSFAQHFRGLWAHARIPDEIEQLAKELHAKGGWPDGWVTVHKTIRFEQERMPSDFLQRLRDLEVAFRPQDLTQKIEIYVLSRTHHLIDIAESVHEEGNSSGLMASWEKVNVIVEDLGQQTANSPEILALFLPDILSHGVGQCFQFGKGIALGAPDLHEVWRQCSKVLSGLPDSERNVTLLCGYIEGVSQREPEIANQLLDEAVSDPILGPFFPQLQTSMPIGKNGVNRLLQSFEVGLAKAWAYRNLAYTRASDSISPSDYKSILLGVAKLSDGLDVSVDLLDMRLYTMKSNKTDIDPDTLALGRELLIQVDFQNCDDNFSYHLNDVAKVCLHGEEAIGAATEVCRNLASALSDYRCGAWHYGLLAGTLFETQSQVALDILLGGAEQGGDTRLSFRFGLDHQSPVNNAPPETLLEWADHDPDDRYRKLAKEIRLFEPSDDKEIFSLSPLALQLIDKAPDRSAVLKIFASRFRPTTWSGSLADVMARYLQPLQQLLGHPDHGVTKWAQEMLTSLSKQIETERQQDRQVDESFE